MILVILITFSTYLIGHKERAVLSMRIYLLVLVYQALTIFLGWFALSLFLRAMWTGMGKVRPLQWHQRLTTARIPMIMDTHSKSILITLASPPHWQHPRHRATTNTKSVQAPIRSRFQPGLWTLGALGPKLWQWAHLKAGFLLQAAKLKLKRLILLCMVLARPSQSPRL